MNDMRTCELMKQCVIYKYANELVDDTCAHVNDKTTLNRSAHQLCSRLETSPQPVTSSIFSTQTSTSGTFSRSPPTTSGSMTARASAPCLANTWWRLRPSSNANTLITPCWAGARAWDCMGGESTCSLRLTPWVRGEMSRPPSTRGVRCGSSPRASRWGRGRCVTPSLKRSKTTSSLCHWPQEVSGRGE